jgi:hypothetical protein
MVDTQEKIIFPITDFISQVKRNWDHAGMFRLYGKDDNDIVVWQVEFKRSYFSNHDLKGMFKYHQLKWEEWVTEWQCQSVSRVSFRIVLFIRKEKREKKTE